MHSENVTVKSIKLKNNVNQIAVRNTWVGGYHRKKKKKRIFGDKPRHNEQEKPTFSNKAQ